MKDIHYTLNRYSISSECTLGTLTKGDVFKCYTLEDAVRNVKIAKETAIPKGTYKVLLRSEGEKHTHYSKLFGAAHHGMLWLQNVNNFQWVYIHVGNSKADTEGCILVGMDAYGKDGRIGRSTNAYKELYTEMSKEILNGDNVYITLC